MSTRSLICMENGDGLYKTVYCHFDGYLSHHGSILVNHYSERETVEKLLSHGDMSVLAERIDPDPSKPHRFGFNESQDGVCVFYGRDRDETGSNAKDLSLRKLDDPSNWTEYVYIFTKDNEWKYFKAGYSAKGFGDVREDLGLEITDQKLSEPAHIDKPEMKMEL